MISFANAASSLAMLLLVSIADRLLPSNAGLARGVVAVLSQPEVT